MGDFYFGIEEKWAKVKVLEILPIKRMNFRRKRHLSIACADSLH